jgi:hypothetical protein
MLTLCVDRQLINTAMKPTLEKDEIAATEATLVYRTAQNVTTYMAYKFQLYKLRTFK